MVSIKEERNFYNRIYLLAFQKDAAFFYVNDCNTIIDYLKEAFWGESLTNRVNLLVKLLYYDSLSNPQYKKVLRLKAQELKHHFNPYN